MKRLPYDRFEIATIKDENNRVYFGRLAYQARVHSAECANPPVLYPPWPELTEHEREHWCYLSEVLYDVVATISMCPGPHS